MNPTKLRPLPRTQLRANDEFDCNAPPTHDVESDNYAVARQRTWQQKGNDVLSILLEERVGGRRGDVTKIRRMANS
jgi:hypothetical protein